MKPPPPIYTRTDTLFPHTTPFRSNKPCAGKMEGAPECVHVGSPRRTRYHSARQRRHRVRCPRPSDTARPLRQGRVHRSCLAPLDGALPLRSEEHTSELQSLMRISYDVFCLKKKTIM